MQEAEVLFRRKFELNGWQVFVNGRERVCLFFTRKTGMVT